MISVHAAPPSSGSVRVEPEADRLPAARAVRADGAVAARSRAWWMVGSRARRVRLAISVIVLLSAWDLLMTLLHMQTTGMAEANPLARYVVRSTGTPWGLVGLKVVSVAVCVGLLGRFRHRRSAEVGSWVALAVLVWLSILWTAYIDAFEDPLCLQHFEMVAADQWVRLPPAG